MIKLTTGTNSGDKSWMMSRWRWRKDCSGEKMASRPAPTSASDKTREWRTAELGGGRGKSSARRLLTGDTGAEVEPDVDSVISVLMRGITTLPAVDASAPRGPELGGLAASAAPGVRFFLKGNETICD